jgi:hypothetical protein
MKKLAYTVAAASAALALPAQAEVLLVSQNYDVPVFIAPGIVGSASDGDLELASAGAWNAAGWSGEYFANRSTGNPAGLSLISISGLAANSAVRVSGILGFLESWDSNNGGGGYDPDFLDVFINGTLVASLTTDNALGTNEIFGGATELFEDVQVNGNSYYDDTLVDFSTATFANSFATAGGTWTFGFQARGAGWQGGSDEGWGIDNIKIYGTIGQVQSGVPEPATWALMILGFGAIGGALRRRQAKTTVVYA